MKKKLKFLFLVLILILVFILFLLFLSKIKEVNLQEKVDSLKVNSNFNSSSNLGNNSNNLNLNESLNSDIKIVFCPSKECFNIYNKTLSGAKEEIVCALYEFDFVNLSYIFESKFNLGVNISIIVDNDYINETATVNFKKIGVDIFSDVDRGTRYNNYMHNKFCVIDDNILITGSANPTINDFLKNNNNILVIESKYLAENYKREFYEMRSGSFGYNKHSTLEYNNLTLIYENDSYLVSSYMCPQDNCEKEVLEILNKANKSIDMAAFSFTNDNIEKMLLDKSKLGVLVRGVVEKRSWNIQGSNAENLSKGFLLIEDKNKYTMHHKFFIVDSRYVITGSMNPTSAGVNYNDENILIIESEKVAKIYQDEFDKLIK